MAPLAKRDDFGKLETKTGQALNHNISLPIQIALTGENMQFLGIFIFAIQIGFALHVIRSGRDRYWLYLMLFLPALGCAIYFFSEVLPELNGSRHVRRAQKQWIDLAKQHV